MFAVSNAAVTSAIAVRKLEKQIPALIKLRIFPGEVHVKLCGSLASKFIISPAMTVLMPELARSTVNSPLNTTVQCTFASVWLWVGSITPTCWNVYKVPKTNGSGFGTDGSLGKAAICSAVNVIKLESIAIASPIGPESAPVVRLVFHSLSKHVLREWPTGRLTTNVLKH